MKFMHLSDLHLGLSFNGLSMLEDQKVILEQILAIAEKEQPEVVLIAGDVYDRQIPPTDALRLFDQFLYRLREQGQEVFVLAGNHDAADRLAQYSRLMDPRIHVAPVYDGSIRPVTLEDRWGALDVFMLPFIKPAHVRRFFPEAEIESYTDMMRAATEAMDVDPARRNVLVCHQYFTGSTRSDSEVHAVGGLDNVDISAVEGFDYVAMGHLHSPQDVHGKCRGRYCGTPLAYSFSEAGQEKSVTMVEMKEKGAGPEVWTLPLKPARQVRKVRGTFEELMAGMPSEDLLQVTLLDEEEIPEVMNRLRLLYPHVLECRYDNRRTAERGRIDTVEGAERKSPTELFGELFLAQNNQGMTEEQAAFIEGLVEEIWEGEA